MKQLRLTVPAQSDWILAAIAAAFGVLVCTGEALGLRCGWSHIGFLFANLIGVLLLPALFLGFQKLGGGKAFLLAIADTKVLFFCFVLPSSLFIQRTYRQKNVGVGIVTVGIVDGRIGAHSVSDKLLLYKFLNQGNLLLLI